jgi:hypothetical protein
MSETLAARSNPFWKRNLHLVAQEIVSNVCLTSVVLVYHEDRTLNVVSTYLKWSLEAMFGFLVRYGRFL